MYTKDNEFFTIKEEGQEKWYEGTLNVLRARNKNYEKMGTLKYEIRLNEKNEKVGYLILILVEGGYLKKGVGHALINEFEQMLQKRDIHEITGRFNPLGEGCYYSRKFYLNHNYEIIPAKKGYKISKFLKYEKTESKKQENVKIEKYNALGF